MKGKKQVERRKHKRFQAPKGLFAGFRPGYTKMGSVVDMSSNGLAFRYVDGEDHPSGTYMDIFMIGDVFHLGEVSVKVISDIEVVGGKSSIRRCGVQFGELTDIQMFQLQKFIQDRTTGEASA
jgi:hypothetical protein